MPAKKKTQGGDPSSAPKLFDVAKPGKTAADATSRPIIVGHSSNTHQDPMVSAPDNDKKTEEDAPYQPRKKMVINPVEHNDNEEENATEKIVDSEEENESEKIADSEAKPPETSDAAALDAVAGAVSAKKEDQKKSDEVAARAIELEKIIESKQYFVPIGEAKRRRSNQRILLIIIVMLAVAIAGINFGIDAEVLDLGIEPLTDIL